MLTCLQVICARVRKEAWLSVSMEIRKNRSCFLGIALISKCLKLGGSVVFTRTFFSSSDCVFLPLLKLREAGRPKESRVNKSFLSLTSTTPAWEVLRCEETWSLRLLLCHSRIRRDFPRTKHILFNSKGWFVRIEIKLSRYISLALPWDYQKEERGLNEMKSDASMYL